MVEKPKVIKVLIENFDAQLGGSHFLKEVGLLKRDPNPKDYDILIPMRFLDLAKAYLKSVGWLKTVQVSGRYGKIDVETIEKDGISIDVFPCEEKISIKNALLHKRNLSSEYSNEGSSLSKEARAKHLSDLLECFANLGG